MKSSIASGSTRMKRRYTQAAVSGTPQDLMKAMYGSQMRSCCVSGRAWRARSKVRRVIVIFFWDIKKLQ